MEIREIDPYKGSAADGRPFTRSGNRPCRALPSADWPEMKVGVVDRKMDCV